MKHLFTLLVSLAALFTMSLTSCEKNDPVTSYYEGLYIDIFKSGSAELVVTYNDGLVEYHGLDSKTNTNFFKINYQTVKSIKVTVLENDTRVRLMGSIKTFNKGDTYTYTEKDWSYEATH